MLGTSYCINPICLLCMHQIVNAVVPFTLSGISSGLLFSFYFNEGGVVFVPSLSCLKLTFLLCR